MDNQYKQLSGRVAVDNSTKTGTILSGVPGGIVRLISAHVFVTTAFSGGDGIVTLRDGLNGTILAKIPATASSKLDMDFHDGLGYPITAGNSLSLEVSGGTTEGSAIGIATGFLCI